MRLQDIGCCKQHYLLHSANQSCTFALLIYSGDYLTKAASNPGAGDILMGFLGSVIISFAFSMFKQRKVIKNELQLRLLTGRKFKVTEEFYCLLERVYIAQEWNKTRKMSKLLMI